MLLAPRRRLGLVLRRRRGPVQRRGMLSVMPMLTEKLATAAPAWAVGLGLSLCFCACKDVEKQRAENDRVEAALSAYAAGEAAEAARTAAHATYLHDRDAIRAEKPKTEADAVRVIHRAPDNIMEVSGAAGLPAMTMLQWFYPDKSTPGRDLIQLTVTDGKITLMNL